MEVCQKFSWFSKTFKTSRLLIEMKFPKFWTFSGNVRIRVQTYPTLVLKIWTLFIKTSDGHCMVFRQKSDSFYTLFKIVDAFPKVLDFSKKNFIRYLKKFGGIQKFCIRFSQKLNHIQQKIRLSVQILRQIFESISPFPQISDDYYEKNGIYSSYLWTVIACFFDKILIIFTRYSNF